MKPLSSCFCLPLQTGVKIVCKILLLLSAVSTSVNLYHLDYKGRRLESTVALAVVALFLSLLTASALVGHAGADRAALAHVLASLALLGGATALWLVLALVSMQWEHAQSVWHVCLQNRCAETLWTVDFGFRNHSYALPDNADSDSDLLTDSRKKILHDDAKFPGIYFMNHRLSGPVESVESDENLFEEEESVELQPKEVEVDENEEDRGEEGRRMSSKQYPEEFREKVVQSEDEEVDDEKTSSGGGSLVVTLVLFLILLTFFLVCATVICSYSTELYEEYKEEDALGREEETDKVENNEVL